MRFSWQRTLKPSVVPVLTFWKLFFSACLNNFCSKLRWFLLVPSPPMTKVSSRSSFCRYNWKVLTVSFLRFYFLYLPEKWETEVVKIWNSTPRSHKPGIMIMLLYSPFLCFRHYSLSPSQIQKKIYSWMIQVPGSFAFYVILTSDDLVVMRREFP